MPFVCGHVRANEKAGASSSLCRFQLGSVPSDDAELHSYTQVEFNRGEHIPTHRTRWGPVDARNFSRQCSVRIFAPCNLKRSILLQLLDHCIRDQDFNVREERAVFEGRNRNCVNVAEVVRLYRSDVIAKAAS